MSVTAFSDLKSASMTGANEVRVVTLTEDEIFQRAREGFIFSHPGAPIFIKRLARSGRLDWAFAGSRQVLRDIEKPVDFLTHEARAAWVLNMHAPMMAGLNCAQRAAVAQLAVTAVRVGTKDHAPAPHAVIHGSGIGPVLLAFVALVLAVVACWMAF